jgi:hypothetical protein
MTCGRVIQLVRVARQGGAPASHGLTSSPRRGEGTLALVLTFALALYAQPASACPPESEGFARLATPEAEIAYRWNPERIKVGHFFEAEVVACRVPGAGAVSRIVIDAQMPAHGHGMNYRPKGAQLAPGRFRFTGLMLHMAGQWQLTFDIYQGETRTRLSRPLDLAP